MTESSQGERHELISSKSVSPTPLIFSARLSLAIWSLVGMMNIYILRVNLSVALVAMVGSKRNSSTSFSDACPPDSNSSRTSMDIHYGEFNWTPSTRSTILAAFFYGYAFTQIPGSLLAKKFRGKKIFGYGVLSTAILTLFTPLAARTSWKHLVALRVLEGVCEGVTFASLMSLLGHWAPPLERSRLTSIALSGQQIGVIVGMPLTGLLCSQASWEWAFYVSSLLAILWFYFWMFLASDDPQKSSRISSDEKEYIISSLNREGGFSEDSTVPWYHIWSSPCVWVLIIGHFCHAWSFYILVTEGPTFLHDMLHFHIAYNGLLSALPYVAELVVSIVYNIFADWLILRCFTTTTVRKLSGLTGFGLISCCLIGLALVRCDRVLAVPLLVGAVAFGGINYSAIHVNHLDLSPKYVGIIFGISNTFATISGIAGPSLVGLFTSPKPTLSGWRSVFFIGAAVAAFGGLFFSIFSSGEVQPWAKDSSDFSVTGCDISTNKEKRPLLETLPSSK